ncbi:unnamed protein product [Prorocentrum cordatum]|uniref:Uncharacterized protein n=1 Tax=Prorocentrum cordatum TaxID=2364126 RepID=A0ABN9SJX8_9DINO|nr:unnamed protein product [Polarella glacialis]
MVAPDYCACACSTRGPSSVGRHSSTLAMVPRASPPQRRVLREDLPWRYWRPPTNGAKQMGSERTTTGQCCSRRAYRQEPVDELTQCRAAVDASQMGSAPPSPLQASCRRLRSPSRRPARGTTRPGPRPHWPRSTRGARARRAPCGGGRRAPPRRRAPPGRPQARGRANLATGAAGRPPPSWSGAREDVRLWRPGQAPPLARARAAEGTPRRTPPPPLGRGGPRTNGFCGTVRVVLAWPTHI